MKKILGCYLIALLLSLPGVVKAQPYTIPWAQQQPAWVFPLWFESGDGQKDTLYLVYHPGMDGNPQPQDTVYGIKPICVSNDSFWVSASYDWTCSDSTTLIYKVLALSMGVVINHGKYPFKMKWDKQLLYDTILPFPDILPKPIARLRGFWDHLYSPAYFGTTENDIIADSIGFPCYYFSFVKVDFDSVVFDGPLSEISVLSSGSNGGPGVSLQLVAQSELCLIGDVPDEEQRVELISFYPNPCLSDLFLENVTRRPVELRVINALGQICQMEQLLPTQNKIADVSLLTPGLYQVFVKTDQYFQTHKLIKL